ncbi:MAG TPA: ELWxxDGT repeat protein [Cyclobacteriaceae bacterium]|nr:ELWxxDGT repeat protein [Cyclobacteriaceae bacterium]
MALLFGASFSAAQIHLVKDINASASIDETEYSSLMDVNGVLYFKSKNTELWKTDGTTAGSVKLKTFSQIYDLKKVGNQLFFFAADTANTSFLWKTDGTVSGTVKVSPKNVEGSYMTDINGLLFFIGRTVKTGLEIWRSDGTDAGTFLVKDIMKGSGNSNATSLVSFSGRLFFVANNGTNGYEIWSSDGTSAGTQLFKDIIAGKSSSAPNYLTAANNTLFFMARDAALGQELWKTDGTSGGTVLVKDLYPGSNSSFPSGFISAGDNIYFSANDGSHSFQLWRSDGTESGTIKLTTNGFNWVNGKVASGSYLYYMLGRSLYRTDGTVAGTQYIANIEDFYRAKEMVEMNGSVYIASTEDFYNNLWKVTGTSATIVAQINHFSTYDYPTIALTSSGNNVYYAGNGGNELAYSLWKSDGTAAGTSSVIDIDQATGNSYPNNLTDFNGTLFFNASSVTNGGMWKSDGTEVGTVPFWPISFSAGNAFNGNLIFGLPQSLNKTDGNAVDLISNDFKGATAFSIVNGSLLFRSTHYPEGIELCKTDGTEAGTVVVKDIYPGGGDGYPDQITEFNGQAFFSASDGSHGIELWKSDGTASGTVLVKDIVPGISSSTPMSLTVYNNQLFFFIYRSWVGFELWKSDGTESGTVFIKQTTPNSTVPAGDMRVVNGILYFTGSDDQGTSLWKTDGTQAGTVKVSDLFPGDEIIYFLKNYNNNLYMLVKASSNFELWKSNGTTSGTVMVKKIGVDYSSHPISEIHNGHLYINVTNKADNNADYQYEVWQTDGTSCGTFRVDHQSNVIDFKHSGTNFFAVGRSGLSGIELLLIEDSEIVPPPCNMREATEDVFSNTDDFNQAISYPNPFRETFSVRLDGKENTSYSMKALNMNGIEMEQYQDLKTNTAYEMGEKWNAGLYVLRIEIDGKFITRKVMKQ